MARTIRQLMMEVKPQDRDKAWLLEALQNAVTLELATLPVYLGALWSIDTSNDPSDVYDLILDVVLEEMGHMGLVCNMLTSLGQDPTINQNVPTYPSQGLPGDVRPELTVYLAGLTKGFLSDVCMQIEYPEGGPIALAVTPGYPTIGAFYDAIEATILALQPTFTGAKQLSSTFSQSDAKIFAITSIDKAIEAIQLIKVQGEGTRQSPYEAKTSGGEFAHYYSFAEVYYGKTLVEVNGRWEYAGDPITFPTVVQMGPIPEGGWPNPPAAVQAVLDASNAAWKLLLDQLNEAWKTGSSDYLNNTAVGTMYTLKTASAPLYTMANAAGGFYGPEFIYK